MIYRALLVDDETPALRFLQAIIEKYLPEYAVAGKATSGAQALAFLRENPVDLLITDISMPGMDGLELARQARVLLPDMHIVIVSGYAEFDYARGAINVAADDYLLKPLSVPGATQAFRAVAAKLDAEYAQRRGAYLCELACGKSAAIPEALLRQPCCFALVRFGNLPSLQAARPFSTGALSAPGEPFTVLRGADEDEQILVSDQPFSAFSAAFASYAAHASARNYTAALNRAPLPAAALHGFLQRAAARIEKCLIIGRRQILYLEDPEPAPRPAENPGPLLNKIERFLESGNMKLVKDTFVNLANEWEIAQYTQQQIGGVVYPLVQKVLLAAPGYAGQQERILKETAELMRCTNSCGNLIAGLYDLLFDNGNFHDKRLTPEELCAYTMTYIRENHAQPLSVQGVCAEIGISQTYLSRLLRKYAGTSFNAYLTQCRIEAAMALIRQHPDILLRDVASCVGYDDQSYFSKVFHQATGQTPTQFAEAAASLAGSRRP